MKSILRISEAATMAIHAMVVLSANQNTPIRVAEVASVIDLSEAHLGKVFQRLSKQGLVISRRGPGGGFILARKPDKIALIDIYQCIDGPLNNDSCILSRQTCSLEFCVFGDLNQRVQDTVRDYLTNTTLQDIRQANSI